MRGIMAIIKIVDRDYSAENSNYDDVDIVMLRYISQSEKAVQGLFLGFNVLISYPEFMAEQFKTVRCIFHKQDGRLLRHFIISYSKNENVDANQAFVMAYDIACYYINEYQIAFAVHQDTEHIHAHFIMNTVSFVDGHKFSEGYEDFNKFMSYAKSKMPNLNFELASAKDLL